jgi:1-acyl-sn-glycerol-3-phosphate acyltransferase
MQNIVLDKPYRFVPPHRGRFWGYLFRHYVLRPYLRRSWGITAAEFPGAELLRASLAAGHGIILATNHCRPCDPMVASLLIDHVGCHLYGPASWHLFMESRLQRWLIRRMGAFSIYREGTDRESLRTAIELLAQAERPLGIFPEGAVSRANDRLNELQEGVAFIARSAAKLRARRSTAGRVVVHPLILKYYFEGDLAATVTPVLEDIERRLSWQPQRDVPLLERTCKIGEALLTLKEIEYFGQPQTGALATRLSVLIERLLAPLEDEWLQGRHDGCVIERVKRVRSAIVPDLVTGGITDAERARRWRQLADAYLAQQVSCYPPDYLTPSSPPEHLLETVERFEEDLTDTARIHRPLRVVLRTGPAIEVSPTRAQRGGDDPLMKQIEQGMQALLHELQRPAPAARAS